MSGRYKNSGCLSASKKETIPVSFRDLSVDIVYLGPDVGKGKIQGGFRTGDVD